MIKKKQGVFSVALIVGIMVLVSGCGHEHTWVDATCTEPRTCSECGETEGEPSGHLWGHPTCTKPKTCKICGATEGDALGHKWLDATCTEPETCELCKETKGEPLGHKVEEWKTTVEPKCKETGTREGKCNVCGELVSETVEATGHTPSDEWQVVEQATSTSAGKRAKVCKVCGEQLETESYELSDEEKEATFKDECQSYTYEQIARNPDDYIGEKAKFTGEVIQSMQEGNSYTLRVSITKSDWGYEDPILVSYTAKQGESRILEDDIVDIYGLLGGTYTYETVMGNKLTVPLLNALYIDIH